MCSHEIKSITKEAADALELQPKKDIVPQFD